MNNGLGYKLANVPTITGLSTVTADYVVSDVTNTSQLIINGVDISSIISQVPINTNNITDLQQVTTGITYSDVGAIDLTTISNNVTVTKNLKCSFVVAANDDVTNKLYVDTKVQPITGFTYSNVGAIDLTTIANNVTVNKNLKCSFAVAANDDVTNKLYVDNKIADLINSAPTTLDTLNELAAALGDDPNYATSTATLIGTKASLTANQTISGINTLSNPSNVFYGDGANLTGIGTAASTIALTGDDNYLDCYIPFSKTISTTSNALYIDNNITPLSYNPNQGRLSTTSLTIGNRFMTAGINSSLLHQAGDLLVYVNNATDGEHSFYVNNSANIAVNALNIASNYVATTLPISTTSTITTSSTITGTKFLPVSGANNSIIEQFGGQFNIRNNVLNNTTVTIQGLIPAINPNCIVRTDAVGLVNGYGAITGSAITGTGGWNAYSNNFFVIGTTTNNLNCSVTNANTITFSSSIGYVQIGSYITSGIGTVFALGTYVSAQIDAYNYNIIPNALSFPVAQTVYSTSYTTVNRPYQAGGAVNGTIILDYNTTTNLQCYNTSSVLLNSISIKPKNGQSDVTVYGNLRLQGSLLYNYGFNINASQTLVQPLSQFYTMNNTVAITVTLPTASATITGTHLIFKRYLSAFATTFNQTGGAAVFIPTASLSPVASVILTATTYQTTFVSAGIYWYQMP